ncbi:substrate-binding periplasmic protein [Marinobacter orientalis]|uniref:Transporter substrate-binding domain-containing protein n=1 Tax=Marinobacter orientalis TaxID=1928859 RepID=A0A7Y0RAR3_9GAMM|nr:transporter substrate-binding domain-containing protein [Marinobacter orientalis]NMT62432.1 transporter substrate-binding domain-containing protein [Marinobacter orientalis]TGX51132.1 transporter substrate-binding domain-containing protein [Marinobacter orientalis]
MSRPVVIIFAAILLTGCSQPDGDPVDAVAQTSSGFSAGEQASLSITGGRADTIVIAAAPRCPHNCEAGSDHEGYLVDLARDILAEAGYTVEYINLSWARALQMTREGQLDAVVGAFITDAPDLVFPDTPQGHSSVALFTHPDNTWHYSGIESLEGQQLLVINGYSYTEVLDSYIRQHQADQEKVWVISGPSPLNRAIELLDQVRTDIFVEDRYVMDWWAMSTGKTDNRPREAGLIDGSDTFVAFSPARKDAKKLAQLLSDGTRQRIEDGRAQQIFDNYGLTLRSQSP